jgi:hypothetical protein
MKLDLSESRNAITRPTSSGMPYRLPHRPPAFRAQDSGDFGADAARGAGDDRATRSWDVHADTSHLRTLHPVGHPPDKLRANDWLVRENEGTVHPDVFAIDK